MIKRFSLFLLFISIVSFSFIIMSCDNQSTSNGYDSYRIFKNQSSYTIQVDILPQYKASSMSFVLNPGQNKRIEYNTDFQFTYSHQYDFVTCVYDGANSLVFYDK